MTTLPDRIGDGHSNFPPKLVGAWGPEACVAHPYLRWRHLWLDLDLETDRPDLHDFVRRRGFRGHLDHRLCGSLLQPGFQSQSTLPRLWIAQL